MCKLADLANAEFKSSNVPKSLLERSDVFAKVYTEGMTRALLQKEQEWVSDVKYIIGSLYHRKPHMKRPYASITRVFIRKRKLRHSSKLC
jgi:hypothetical protein